VVGLHIFESGDPQQEPLKPGDELAQLLCPIGQIRLLDSGELIVEENPNFQIPPQFKPVLTHLQQELRKRYFLDATGRTHIFTTEILESTQKGAELRQLLVEHVRDATRNTLRAAPITREEQKLCAKQMELIKKIFRRLCTPQE